MTGAKNNMEVANDTKDKIVLMGTHLFAHRNNNAFVLPEMVNTMAQVTKFSPHAMDSKEGKNGQDWTFHFPENVNGLKHDKMPALMQQNLVGCGARSADTIDDNKTMIGDTHILPCQLLCCILGSHRRKDHCVRPECAHFCKTIRDFLKKDGEEKAEIHNQCIKNFKNNPNHIHERPGEQF